MEKGRTFGFSHVVSERSVSVGSNVLPKTWHLPYIDHLYTQGLDKTPQIIDKKGVRVYTKDYSSTVLITSVLIELPKFITNSSQVSIEFPFMGATIAIDEGKYGGNGRKEKKFNCNIDVNNHLLEITGLMGELMEQPLIEKYKRNILPTGYARRTDMRVVLKP